MIKAIFWTVCILLALYIAYAVWHVFSRFQISKTLVAEAVPFSQTGTGDLRVLVVGDSTAVGVGATTPEDSLAGRIGKEFPEYTVEVHAQSGAKLASGEGFLGAASASHYACILIQLGANDIVGRTGVSDARVTLRALLSHAHTLSDHVYVLHSGNVGAAALFPFPLDRLYEKRTRVYRAMYLEEATVSGAHYIDLFNERAEDVFAHDPGRYLARDSFHPSSDGYAVWYGKVREALASDGMLQ